MSAKTCDCSVFTFQRHENLYLSKPAFEEIKQALKDAGYDRGVYGFVGHAHTRFNGAFIVGRKSLNQKVKK